jgi:hypothetical protein
MHDLLMMIKQVYARPVHDQTGLNLASQRSDISMHDLCMMVKVSACVLYDFMTSSR